MKSCGKEKIFLHCNVKTTIENMPGGSYNIVLNFGL